MTVEMKNLNINGINFEIVDAKSRSDIGPLKSDVVNNITNPDEYPLSIAEGIIQATMEIGGLSRTDGSETDKTGYVRLADYFAVESGKTYTFANSGDFRICVLCYDSNLVFIEGWNKDGDTTYPYAWISSGGKLKIPSGASYIRFYCNVSNDLSVVYTISEDGATQSSKVEFVKQYFKNHGYAIYGDNIDNETTHKLVIEALGQHGNTYNVTEIKAPNSNPQEATLCLMNSGNGKTHFVDISSMVYDENNPTVEIVNQVRGGKKLPEFRVAYNDGRGAGRVKKFTVKPDAIPVELTAEGLRIRKTNTFDNNGLDDDYITVNFVNLLNEISDKVPKSDYSPTDKTETMTQPVGKDADGKLWTVPSLSPPIVSTSLPDATADNYARFCIVTIDETDRLFINLKTNGVYGWIELK